MAAAHLCKRLRPAAGVSALRRPCCVATLIAGAGLGALGVGGAPPVAAAQPSGAERTSRPSSTSRGQELLGECQERLARLQARLAPPDAATPTTPEAVVRADAAAFGRRPVRLVTFDLDDTLWDTWAVLTRAHEVKQAYVEENYPRIARRWDLAATRQHNTEVRNSRPDLAHSFTESHREAIRLQAKEVGYDEVQAVDDIFGAFAVARNDVTLYEGALEMLRGLRNRGVVVGTITNGNADATKVPGLRDVISFAVTAHQAGAAKPDPAVFQLALTRAAEVTGGAAIEPAEVVHVGDDLTSDVLGAQQVGFRTIHFLPPSRRGDGVEGGDDERRPADATVASLQQILEVVCAWIQ